jgi:putative transposase
MTCPRCQASHTLTRPQRTALGDRRFRCRTCGREFNECTGTPFNRLQYPTDVACLFVFWRLRYCFALFAWANWTARSRSKFRHM